MAHNIAQHGDKAAYAGAREMPWHMLGTTVPERMGIQEALKLAYLNDWNVRKVGLITSGADGVPWGDALLPLPKHVATVRTNPWLGNTDVLGVVGKDYKVFQNEEVFAFGDNILDTGAAQIDTAGALADGTVFVCFSTEEFVVPGTDDKLRPYLLITFRHDGTLAVTVRMTTIRVVCQNTLGMAMGEKAAPTFKVNHVGRGLDGRVMDARQALGLLHKGVDNLSALAAEWAAKDVSRDEFERITKRLIPVDPDKLTKREVQSRYDKWRLLDRLTHEDATQESVRGSAWGFLNAAIEMNDWHSRDRANAMKAAVRQATSVDSARFKRRATLLIGEELNLPVG